MSDLGMSVRVTRTLLGLPDLDINDFVSYYVGANFLGGPQNWNRAQVGSPFLDGQVTTYRQRQNVTEPIQIEVLGGDPAEVTANLSAVVDAFNQDTYTVNIQIGDQNIQYLFESADVTMPWAGARWIANQCQLNFSAQRQPGSLVNGVSF
jgi:hypothetical protein